MRIFTWIKKIDVRDIIFCAGLVLLGYGLFLFLPWVSFTVCGGLLIALSITMRGRD